MLHNGQHHAINSGDYRKNKDDVSKDQVVLMDQHQHSQYAIDPGFDDDTRHHSRYMGRCSRMSPGKPCMKGHKAGLNRKSDKKGQE